MAFKDGFLWGVASASYQIEGSPYKVGGGMSVWDMFCRREGAISDGSNGDVACDHYNRYAEDAALMQTLGIPNYRMSISWPRVLPAGKGKVSEEGLGFYDRLVDELLARGVQPHATLFHWDYPYELYCEGGWLNRDSADFFADYTRIVVERLSDRVKSWMTLNEPQVFVGMGHRDGTHAPGDKMNWPEALRVGHHVLLAHGKSCQAIRACTKQPCEIGWAPVGSTAMPATDQPEDVEAARTAMFSVYAKTFWTNSWWADPAILGHYPEDGLRMFGSDFDCVRPGDLETICQPLDFYGANIYLGHPFRADEEGKPQHVDYAPGIGRTIYHWPVTPEALYWGPKFLYERYKLPIMITENGVGMSDWIHLDGKIHDPGRVDYLHRYIREFKRAAADGVDAKGYFQWSFSDNFEWYEGFKFRFGLVHIDYETQKRTPKESAYWYKQVIASNGADL